MRVREELARYSGISRLWRASTSSRRTDPLLLDTHVWLWTVDGIAGSLSRGAIGLVERAAADRRLYVSDVSHWEVALKVSKERLDLASDPVLWLARAAMAPGIQSLPLSREVLIQSTMLPGSPHGDPADRMLIAQALLGGLSLVTCDKGIIAYAEQQSGVPVCDARG